MDVQSHPKAFSVKITSYLITWLPNTKLPFLLTFRIYHLKMPVIKTPLNLNIYLVLKAFCNTSSSLRDTKSYLSILYCLVTQTLTHATDLFLLKIECSSHFLWLNSRTFWLEKFEHLKVKEPRTQVPIFLCHPTVYL